MHTYVDAYKESHVSSCTKDTQVAFVRGVWQLLIVPFESIETGSFRSIQTIFSFGCLSNDGPIFLFLYFILRHGFWCKHALGKNHLIHFLTFLLMPLKLPLNFQTDILQRRTTPVGVMTIEGF